MSADVLCLLAEQLVRKGRRAKPDEPITPICRVGFQVASEDCDRMVDAVACHNVRPPSVLPR